jgi:hypothetical protein
MEDIKYKWFQDGGFVIRYRELYLDFELIEVPQFGGNGQHIGFFNSIDGAKAYADILC